MSDKGVRVPTEAVFRSYTGLHCRQLWAEVGEDYVCPSCKRNKFQILRWTTRFPKGPSPFKGWVAVLHRHHDHSQGFMTRSLGRFPETVICDQCNSADGVAKRKLGLPRDFSFSPQEIGSFVVVTPHGRHRIKFDEAKRIYEGL